MALLAGPAPAHASLEGPCNATGTLVGEGTTYDAKDLPDVVEIPASDSVDWKGSVDAPEAERPIQGEVIVKFPAPIGDVTVGEWDGPSSRVQNSGTYDYDVPSAIAGIEIPIEGTHSEPGVECSGTAVVKVKGTSPLLYASLAFTVVSAIGVALAIKVKP